MTGLAGVVALVACTSSVSDPFGGHSDGGANDAGDLGDGAVDPTIGAPCTDDSQCDDHIPCTFDRCDHTIAHCRHVPDDSQCADGVYCNGVERCDPLAGCKLGAPEESVDGNTCTIDRCVEATKSCEHTLRDADGDGDPVLECQSGGDCDDTDPTVSSKAHEICGNGKDDNCNGQVDEMPCDVPEADTCDHAKLITQAGTYFLSTVAARHDYATSCAPGMATAQRDVVADIVVPPGPKQDLELWAYAGGADVTMALDRACGDGTSELACTSRKAGVSERILGRSLDPGHYFVTLSAVAETSIQLKVNFLSATTRPTNETCASAASISIDTSVPMQIVDPAVDNDTACDRTGGELAYSFALPEPRDIHVYMTTTVGTGQLSASLRDAACAETACRTGKPLFVRNLAAGAHALLVSATASVDGTLLIATSPPTLPKPDESCATAAAIALGSTVAVDLTDHTQIATGCLAGAPSAAYLLTLTEPSDVLVVGRFPAGATGAVSLHSSATCNMTDTVACATGTTPQRITKRNLAAGTYRIVVAQADGLPSTVGAFVRPTTAPVTVNGADTCASAFVVPDSGGYFVGDTRMATSDYSAGCDAVGAGGAKDQMLKITLPANRRVILDSFGSAFTTLLDLRDATTCPGDEIPGACYVGFGANRSFLDVVLPAGGYYVQVDGYNGESGTWALDVRVVVP
jgi:hypothetical protein